MNSKICNKCKEKKDIENFHKSRSFKDGFNVWCKDCHKNYKKENKEHYILYQKEWRKTEKGLALRKRSLRTRIESGKLNDYTKKKYNSDSSYKVMVLLKNRFYTALKNQNTIKSKKLLQLLGCTLEELKLHLESKFTEGMNWDNYGEWHIDHIRSCASFDLSDPEQQKECFHHTNLQPLWAKDNLHKHSKYNNERFYKLKKIAI